MPRAKDAAAGAAAVSTEEIHRIMQQSLEEHSSNRVEGLIANRTKFENEALHYHRLCKELQTRHVRLEERMTATHGSKTRGIGGQEEVAGERARQRA